MGFDLYGIKAKSKSGEYFRNNVWWWRPLWGYICVCCDNILTKEEQSNGHMNNGIEIGPVKAILIAQRLQESIDNGLASKYKDEYTKMIKKAKKHNTKLAIENKSYDWNAAYPFSMGNLKDFIKFCRASGGFIIR